MLASEELIYMPETMKSTGQKRSATEDTMRVHT